VASGALNFSNNSGNFWRWFLGTSGEMRFDSADGVSKMYLTETGNLGLGGSPGAKLHTIGGDILLDNTYSIQWKDSGGTARDIVTVDSADNTTLRHPAGSSGDVYLGSASLFTLKSATGNLGLGTATPLAPLHIDTTGTDDSLLITNDDATADAAPVITLKRDSASPADGDYLGQIKFKGENDASQEIVYAKITGKISDVTDTTEDGLIETMVKAGGSNLIVSRQTHTDLKLINGIGLQVDGNVGIGTTSPGELLDVDGDARITNLGLNTLASSSYNLYSSNGAVGLGGALFEGGSNAVIIDDINDYTGSGVADFTVFNGSQLTQFGTSSGYAAVFDGGNVGIGTTSPSALLDVDGDLRVAGNEIKFNEDRGFIYDSAQNRVGISTDLTLNMATAAVVVESDGNVGIGLVGADHLLEIADGFRTAPVSSPSGTAESGRIYMDSDDDRLKVYANGADRPINTMTPIMIRPQQLIADSTNGFGITTSNQHVLAAFDASTDEIGYYTGVLPDDYQGDGLTVEINWISTATTGDVRWSVAIERLANGGTDLNSDSFSADNVGTSTTRSTPGIIRITSINFTDGGDMDGMLAGDFFRLRITRDADDASDTMTADAQIVGILIKGTNDA
jgi:hypothetical protein